MKPDFIRPHGMAWKMDIDAISKKAGNKPHSTLASWVVSAPWAHPMWHSYHITCIHLRPIPGFGPAKIYLAGATHEIHVLAIDPAWSLDVTEWPPVLYPLNFAGQFKAVDDDAAAARIFLTVVEIADGKLNPDTDAIQQWVKSDQPRRRAIGRQKG